MRLYLIRHGETEGNIRRLLDTEYPGTNLTETGRAQAQRLVKRLADFPIDSISISNLPRTRQTATPLAVARDLPLIERPGLAEVEAGEWEALTTREAYEGYRDAIFTWLTGDLDYRMGHDGTTGRKVIDRMNRAISDIEVSGANHAAAFSHGVMIAFWTRYISGEPSDQLLAEHPVVNTQVVTLDGSLDSGYRLINWGFDSDVA